jgi:DNA-binding NtrC family response regulator
MTRRVLLVGGDAQILAELGEYLDHRDNEVESVGYCDDALMRLRHQPFDLVLVLSLNAPWRTWSSLSSPTPRNIGSTSAIMFLKQMRGLYTEVPVIVVSGNLRAEVEAEALANGAFAFIPRPVNVDEFDRLVALALQDRDGNR